MIFRAELSRAVMTQGPDGAERLARWIAARIPDPDAPRPYDATREERTLLSTCTSVLTVFEMIDPIDPDGLDGPDITIVAIPKG